MLDRESVAEYDLVVHVVDTYNSSWSCSSRVFISLLDINDSPPKFILSNLSASLPENSKVGAVVTLVHAVDSDIGNILNCIKLTNLSFDFSLNIETG